jgi:hypothetical protein
MASWLSKARNNIKDSVRVHAHEKSQTGYAEFEADRACEEIRKLQAPRAAHLPVRIVCVRHGMGEHQHGPGGAASHRHRDAQLNQTGVAQAARTGELFDRAGLIKRGQVLPWTCKECTFTNRQNLHRCGVCEAKRIHEYTTENSPSTPFCTQCGQLCGITDRCCAACGYQRREKIRNESTDKKLLVVVSPMRRTLQTAIAIFGTDSWQHPTIVEPLVNERRKHIA